MLSINCMDFLNNDYISPLDPSELVMDDNIFKSAPYQRVFQYLRHYTGGANLDTFKFNQTVEGTPQDCLQMILR